MIIKPCCCYIYAFSWTDPALSQVAEMGLKRMLLFHFPMIFFMNLSFHAYHSIAADSISPGQSLSGNQTITSQGGMFVLGFFSPGNSSNYYIGIWQNKISKPKAVWVANRETPLPNTSSELMISEEGNLTLIDQSRIPIWSTNSTSLMSNSTVAVLLDTGNLILRDGSNSSLIFWQSFDHPTDTWLPGGKIGLSKITGEPQRLVSWRNSEDPYPGIYSFETNGTNMLFLLWNESKKYWNSGTWNGQVFSLIPESIEFINHRTNNVISISFVTNDKESYFTFSVSDPSLYVRIVLDSSTGKLGVWSWLESIQNWILSWSTPTNQCEVYAVCGPSGVCNSEKSMSICTCLQGFEPRSLKDWNLGDRTGGCMRRTSLQCGNNSSNEENDGFFMTPNIQFPDNPLSLRLGSAEECELVCLNNCSCVAYAYAGGCLIWKEDLWNARQMIVGNDGEGGDLYLRLAMSDLPKKSKRNRRTILGVIIGAIGGVIAILCTTFVLIRRTKRRRLNGVAKEVHGSLVLFRYTDLQHATKNFSENLGAGSFGSVFKGTLPDSSTAIAVKKLNSHGWGEKEFRMEVNTVGIIQHINLVRLRGFCSEGSERLLVYDFMPNGSLDSHLFQKKSETLDWKRRYQIALGTARGLAYLHEKCRDYIIHCDIKPENILLDAEFCAKVADFGMAKLLGREFSKVLTTMRGTIGYLAPEWISGLPITPKADVYSYGMMVLEIISGIRNAKNTSHNGSVVCFPAWAATMLHEGDVLSITDARLEGNVDMEELRRACIAACWCVQDQEASRPSMGQVIQILEGVLEVNLPPVPSRLQHLVENEAFYSDDQDSSLAASTSK